MCGIGGLLALKPLPDLAAKLARLSELQRHRGPDDAGFLTWSEGRRADLGRDPNQLAPGRLALVHRRLSIFDLSPLGWQPMLDASGQRAVVFNGEIYNYRELKAELEAEGHRFKSTSDTEVLLAILARDGLAGLSRLVGMYAFAYADFERRRLTLVRDPLGIKPLHYARSQGFFAFASEIKPLLDIGAARRTVDRGALFRFLRHAVTNHGAQTVFADVKELPPGHALEIDFDTPLDGRITPFWQPRPARDVRRISPADAAAELAAILMRTVELHMRADVPCAAALSGGVDSSGIVAMMRRQLGVGTPIDVFSYVADDERLSERRWIDITAKATGARVHEVRLEPEHLAHEIDGLIRQQEQPFTTTSMWAQAHVYRAAHAAGFKIVIDGQGADETLAGYAVFRAARIEGLLRRGGLGEARALLRQIPAGRNTALMLAAGGLLPRRARDLMRRAIGKPIIPGWLDGAWFGEAAVEHLPERGEAHSPLAAALRDAVTGSSLPMLLRYADRNAMMHSVENRVPYLTTELVEFAFSLPDEILISADGTLKRVLRDALRGLVPDPILDRRDKIGFETPEAIWFRTHQSLKDLARETAAMPLPPCFTPEARHGLEALGNGTTPFTPQLWRTLNVIRWAKEFGVSFDEASERDRAA